MDSVPITNAMAMLPTLHADSLAEPELTAGRLTNEIFSLFDQPREIEKQSTAARGLARPHAVRDIVNLIEEVARPRGLKS